MIDYTIFYKNKYKPDDPWWEGCEWNVFISAYNSSERVQKLFESAPADQKHWLIFPEYEYKLEEFPRLGTCFAPRATNEAYFLREYLDLATIDFKSSRICLDITGFMRPYLMVIFKLLWLKGVKQIDVVYSDPNHYVSKENTVFSSGDIAEVRQVSGFEGTHNSDFSNDVLIIGAGYDHDLISQVADSKAKSRKIQIFGLPSLQADMFQENVLRASRASESIGAAILQDPNYFFAPANDPFVTASVLQDIMRQIKMRRSISNLYLSPLATKAQVLGFVLYYIYECENTASSIIFPYAQKYSRETTRGVSRVWRYRVELP